MKLPFDCEILVHLQVHRYPSANFSRPPDKTEMLDLHGKTPHHTGSSEKQNILGSAEDIRGRERPCTCKPNLHAINA